MRKSWVSFARTGNPSTDDFRWPERNLEHRRTVSIDDQFSVLEGPYLRQRHVLDELMTMSWKD